MNISDLMTRNPVTVGCNDQVKGAKRKMTEHGIKHLPVVNDERFVVGILTDRDIKLKQAVSDDPSFHDNAVVSEVCIANPFCVPPNTRIQTVLQEMLKRKIGSTLITEDGRIVGIFTSVDAVKALGRLLEAGGR